MLAELLKKWAELEPNRAEFRTDREKFFILRLGKVEYVLETDAIEKDDLALLQHSLQESIANHQLLYKLENNVEGNHYASVCQSGKSSFVIHQNKDSAIALLKAYISYLEEQQAAAPT